MSRAGDCYDNAVMESCFGTIKTELEMTTYQSFDQARREIQEYINYYNRPPPRSKSPQPAVRGTDTNDYCRSFQAGLDSHAHQKVLRY